MQYFQHKSDSEVLCKRQWGLIYLESIKMHHYCYKPNPIGFGQVKCFLTSLVRIKQFGSGLVTFWASRDLTVGVPLTPNYVSA